MPIPNSSNYAAPAGPFREQMIWDQLKTVYDPEIPVNIVDLGLIYEAAAVAADDGGKRISVRMTLTAPGCSMSDVIKAEVEQKLARLPEVTGVNVDVTFDPPWDQSKMSDAAKLQLGFDVDPGPRPADRGSFRIVR